MTNTLFITNDFPPRPGGIQTFVFEIASRFDSNKVTVLASTWNGAADFDAKLPFPVVRAKTKILLPTRKTYNLAKQLIKEKNIEQVVFGASAPLGLLANKLRKLGVKNFVAFTHGHEVGWVKTPGTKQLMRKIANDVDALTYLTNYTKNQIAKGLTESQGNKLFQLLPAVDTELFNPKSIVAGRTLRKSIGLSDRPVIVSVSRLMARKGHDELIKALPIIQNKVPGAALVIVGDGSYRPKLEKLVRKLKLENDVYFAGKVAHADLPNWYAVGDVFAMPCRTRLADWDVEGLGIVYLEASATGLPVIAGTSGGAPEAVLPGKSGFVVNGKSTTEIASQLVALLSNPDLREQMGKYGRTWVEQDWTWDKSFNDLTELLIN